MIVTRDIYSYIAGDLQEEGPGGEKYNKFVDELNHKIVTLSNSSDVADKKAAVLSIGLFSFSYFRGRGLITRWMFCCVDVIYLSIDILITSHVLNCHVYRTIKWQISITIN